MGMWRQGFVGAPPLAPFFPRPASELGGWKGEGELGWPGAGWGLLKCQLPVLSFPPDSYQLLYQKSGKGKS